MRQHILVVLNLSLCCLRNGSIKTYIFFLVVDINYDLKKFFFSIGMLLQISSVFFAEMVTNTVEPL